MKEEERRRGIVIAVSGPPASGKTTHARYLAERFGLRYVSAGSLFREMAMEMGISLEEFHKMAESDHRYDIAVDKRSIEEAKKGNVVLDGHLTAWITREYSDLKIYLTAPLEERARRLAEREGKNISQALEELRMREESNRRRYLEIYGIDIGDLSIFDLVINTSRLPAESVRRILEVFVEEYLKHKGKCLG